MTEQIELFTPAIAHKQQALDALQRFALKQAKTELELAREIDPYLADIKTLLQAVDLLLQLGIRANTRAPGLAAAWHKVRDLRATLPRAVYSVVETAICERAVHSLPPDYSDFVDAKAKVLHIGYCYLVLDRLEQAHKKLLDYLTRDHDEEKPTFSKKVGFWGSRATLWGYFGDASYQLKRREESNSGYLRALFMDAQAVDLERLQHPDLRRIFQVLRNQHPQETARALLPIHAWLEKVLHIPKGNTYLARVIRQQRFDHSAQLLLYPAQRYHQFALCLYIDQAGLHRDIDFVAREEMQRLDERLFQRYLEQVGRRQQ